MTSFRDERSGSASPNVVVVRGLRKRFSGDPPVAAVDDLSFEIQEGAFLVLLGPSGCGKTTTLRCIAGLEDPDAGQIRLRDRVVFDRSAGVNIRPNKRNVGVVFQSYALWPHMSVRKNIEYPLRARRVVTGLREDWTLQAARLVHCEHLLGRYPGQLSGGQQQRVALARSLVARPDLVLMDEPLSNLDERLRDDVRSELSELHRRLAFSAVYVTHDQHEALSLGDRLAVMRDGRLEQLGTPQEVFDCPSTDYVAEFMGMANQLVITRSDGGWWIGDQRLHGDLRWAQDLGPTVSIRLRPIDLSIADATEEAAEGVMWFAAHVVDRSYVGDHYDLSLSLGERRLRSTLPIRLAHQKGALEPGVVANLRFSRLSVRAFDPVGNAFSVPGLRSLSFAADILAPHPVNGPADP